MAKRRPKSTRERTLKKLVREAALQARVQHCAGVVKLLGAYEVRGLVLPVNPGSRQHAIRITGAGEKGETQSRGEGYAAELSFSSHAQLSKTSSNDKRLALRTKAPIFSPLLLSRSFLLT